MNEMLNHAAEVHRQNLINLMADLGNFALSAGNQEHRDLLQALQERSNDPFLFVIVGEVKAGKSSFINALLQTDTEICKVAPQPMTDSIQQVRYGETERSVQISPHLKEIYYPVDILKNFAIVDTPGTNTIIAHHQEITERFIPSSDLVVFVFEAKNPYRQSSWEFLAYIQKEWRKKVIFILQQKDLLPEKDLEINMKGVAEHAAKEGINDALIFAVSAKLEQEGQTEVSGFNTLRTHIHDSVTGGQAAFLKQESVLSSAATLFDKMEAGLSERRQQWQADMNFREGIGKTLSLQSTLSNNQVDHLIENIENAYVKLGQKYENELSDGLSFGKVINRTIAGLFQKQATLQNWLQDLVKGLDHAMQTDLKARLDQQIIDVADRIQFMAKAVEQEMQRNTTILAMDHEIYSDIAERRASVLKDLLQSFQQFMQRGENFMPDDMFSGSKSLAPNVATGSGVAVVGMILATVTQGMVFDITGGVLTAVGFLFAGISFGFQRNAILKRYRQEIENGRQTLHIELETRLLGYVKTIRNRIEANFNILDLHLQKEATSIGQLENKAEMLRFRLDELKNQIQKSLTDNL